MVSPEYPEIFERESFQDYGKNVSDWTSLRKAVERWQNSRLTLQQEHNLRLFAPAMGVLSLRNKMFEQTGFKAFRNKKGRTQLRDSKGHFVKVGENKEKKKKVKK